MINDAHGTKLLYHPIRFYHFGSLHESCTRCFLTQPSPFAEDAALCHCGFCPGAPDSAVLLLSSSSSSSSHQRTPPQPFFSVLSPAQARPGASRSPDLDPAGCSALPPVPPGTWKNQNILSITKIVANDDDTWKFMLDMVPFMGVLLFLVLAFGQRASATGLTWGKKWNGTFQTWSRIDMAKRTRRRIWSTSVSFRVKAWIKSSSSLSNSLKFLSIWWFKKKHFVVVNIIIIIIFS